MEEQCLQKANPIVSTILQIQLTATRFEESVWVQSKCGRPLGDRKLEEIQALVGEGSEGRGRRGGERRQDRILRWTEDLLAAQLGMGRGRKGGGGRDTGDSDEARPGR